MSHPTRLITRSLLSTLAALLLAAAPAARADEAGKAVIRISAGATAEHKDAEGHTWLADQGFTGGDIIDRDADMKIANTTIPSVYRTEHYSMDGFSYKLPNGKYTVKLHFAETYEGIDGAGQRVFSFNVEGHDYKDFDVFVKAGGVQRAYVVSVDVEIKDGKLDITFTSNIENPEINGIEIIPAA
jgi:endoglucanase